MSASMHAMTYKVFHFFPEPVSMLYFVAQAPLHFSRIFLSCCDMHMKQLQTVAPTKDMNIIFYTCPTKICPLRDCALTTLNTGIPLCKERLTFHDKLQLSTDSPLLLSFICFNYFLSIYNLCNILAKILVVFSSNAVASINYISHDA